MGDQFAKKNLEETIDASRVLQQIKKNHYNNHHHNNNNNYNNNNNNNNLHYAEFMVSHFQEISKRTNAARGTDSRHAQIDGK